MSQKHMTKKELKEDPFFEEVAHIVEFFRKHQILLVTIIAVIVVALAVVFGGNAIIKNQNDKASGYFGIAMDYYGKAQMNEAEDQFLLVVEQYPRTDWGKRSFYYLGLVSRELNQPEEEALEYFEKFVSSDIDDSALKASAYQLIGTYFYRNGDVISAGDNYLNAAKKAIGKKEKLALGLRAGDAFVEAGDSKGLDKVVKYLASLELSEIDKARVEALAKR
jgi:TolA-binding protein